MSGTADAPSDLLVLADSDDWRARCQAARELAGFEGARAPEALLRLLCDREDTAPIEAAAQELLKRRDLYGARLIFAAISMGDDDAADHLAYFVMRDAAMSDYTIWTFAAESVNAEDEAVRDGACELLP